jgi:hypothetical protein
MGGDKRGDIRGTDSGQLGKTWGNCLDKGPYLIPTIPLRRFFERRYHISSSDLGYLQVQL